MSDYLRPTVSSTLYRFFDTPSTWFIQQRYLWSDHHSLENENKQLRKRVAELRVNQQQLMAQIQENKTLRDLLSASSLVNADFTHAKVIAIPNDINHQTVIIDQGKLQGVYVGQAVLDSYGVFGYVVETNDHTSIVLLTTDTDNFIPVQNENGYRSIAQGNGMDQSLSLLYVVHEGQFSVGDQLVTSGLDLRYAQGYPVGSIEAIDDVGADYLRITITPAAQIDMSRDIMLVWPESNDVGNEAKRVLHG